MSKSVKKLWESATKKAQKRQVAALCYRKEDDETKVLLVTSRGTGRWIIPKGWPIRGKNAPESALQEAWEEAGVAKGKLAKKSIGSYFYNKNKGKGKDFPVKTSVYPIAVKKLKDEFPEVKQRRRKWVSVKKAANMVREPELRSILRDIAADDVKLGEVKSDKSDD